MEYIIITNNDLVLEILAQENVIFINSGVKEVFETARDYINRGYHFYVHPLSLNIEVHKIPVRSLVMTKQYQSIMDEVSMIDNVLKKEFCPFEGTINDFKEIDANFIKEALRR
ncbi:MAG: GrdX family protein [Thermoanaerobacteraceae bacterium]|nr:GrdX family protein [Thermoanaerobacteraceae bacterium]